MGPVRARPASNSSACYAACRAWFVWPHDSRTPSCSPASGLGRRGRPYVRSGHGGGEPPSADRRRLPEDAPPRGDVGCGHDEPRPLRGKCRAAAEQSQSSSAVASEMRPCSSGSGCSHARCEVDVGGDASSRARVGRSGVACAVSRALAGCVKVSRITVEHWRSAIYRYRAASKYSQLSGSIRHCRVSIQRRMHLCM